MHANPSPGPQRRPRPPGSVGSLSLQPVTGWLAQRTPRPPGSVGSVSLQPVTGRLAQRTPRPPGSVGSVSLHPWAAARPLTIPKEPKVAVPVTMVRNERRDMRLILAMRASPSHALPANEQPCVDRPAD
jgi:hypothetical protein